MPKRRVARSQKLGKQEVSCGVEDGRLVLSGQPAGIFRVYFMECGTHGAGLRLTFVIGGVRGSKSYCSALLPRGWDFPWFEKLLEVVHLLAPWPDELHYVCRHLEGLSFFVEVAGDGAVEFLQLADG
jgi:hypothetical protein